jgi:hypothetical protein
LTENIRLDRIFSQKSSNPRIEKAQEKLQKSTEQLGAALQRYSETFKFSDIADDGIKPVAAETQDTRQMDTGEAFCDFVDRVSAEQEKRKDTIPGKVSSFMKQVYPVAIIILGIASSVADVSFYLMLQFK